MALITGNSSGRELDGAPYGYRAIYIPQTDDSVFSEFVNDYIEMFKKIEPELYEYIMKIEPRFPNINATQFNELNKIYGYPERRISPMNIHFHEYIVELKQFIDDARINREKEEIKQPQIVPVAELIDYNLIDFPPISVEVDDCGEIRMQSQQDIFKPQTESKSIETQTESSEVVVSYSVGRWMWIEMCKRVPNSVVFHTFPNGIQVGSKVIHTFDYMSGPQVGSIVTAIEPTDNYIIKSGYDSYKHRYVFVSFSEPFLGCNRDGGGEIYLTTEISRY